MKVNDSKNIEILKGTKFGFLTVLNETPTRKNHKYYLSVPCRCGKIVDMRRDVLVARRRKSCGCVKKVVYIGQQFGHLYIESLAERRPGRDGTMYNCVCSCGMQVKKALKNLLRANIEASCGCKLRKVYTFEDAVTSVFATYVRGARDRGLEFKIDKEHVAWFMQQNCWYCGVPPSNSYYYAKNIKYNGIDRSNSDIGYTLENLVPCCSQCNIAKRDHTPVDFFNWIQRLHTNLFTPKNEVK